MNRSIKMMKPMILLLLLGGIMITGGCKKVSYHQLSDEDMSWLVYGNNQVDRFTNSNNVTVKYLVTLRTKTYNDNGDVANEFTTAYFQQLNDTSAFIRSDGYGQLYIYKQEDDNLLVALTWPHFPLQGVPLNNQVPTLATIDGVNYADVYIINGSAFTDARFYISKIWYSKSTGVLQYEDRNGVTWVKQF